MSVGDRIRQRRLALGMNADKLGEMIGKNRATIYRYEKGDIENVPSPIIKELAEALHTSVEYLMGWEESAQLRSGMPGDVPLIYGVAAGVPILAEDNIIEYMPVSVRNADECFALVVRGESMVNANIPDGCRIVVHMQHTAENGQIVVCRVNRTEATLKRFKRLASHVLLMPENPAFEPIIVPAEDFDNGDAEILGVVVQIIIDV